jgi:hypothetical protein
VETIDLSSIIKGTGHGRRTIAAHGAFVDDNMRPHWKEIAGCVGWKK